MKRDRNMVLLNPVESRFPLTRGRTTAAVTTTEVGDAEQLREPQRFGLRFFVRDAVPPAVPAFTYCLVRQVTVDDHDVPIVHGPLAGWSQTTTGNMDGNEETKMDQDPDSN